MTYTVSIWDSKKLLLFIVFVIPGFVTLKVYELLVPGETKESSKQLIDAVAFSCINYAILAAPIYLVETHALRDAHPFWYAAFYLFVLLVSPIAWPFLWVRFRNTRSAQRILRHPIGKPWDFVFEQGKSYWVIVSLKGGDKIAGLYGNSSFASSAPNREQIYLEEAWHMNEDGGFDRARDETAGIIVLTKEIDTVELFNS